MTADVFDHPLGHYFPTKSSGPGAEIDHMVGCLDGVGVVLHHDDGVAQIPKTSEGPQQPFVVSLVQPDAGFVQDVEHPNQSRPDLGGEPDALGLAPGK